MQLRTAHRLRNPHLREHRFGRPYDQVRCFAPPRQHDSPRSSMLEQPFPRKVEAEIKAGKLHLSNQPTAGHRCLGPASAYDASTNTANAQIRCWQSIHFPFRTAREVGFPDMSEVPAALRTTVPYVMSSGKYWAHVMIEHPAK